MAYLLVLECSTISSLFRRHSAVRTALQEPPEIFGLGSEHFLQDDTLGSAGGYNCWSGLT